MNEFSLKELMEKAHDIEFSKYDNPSKHIFSLRHKRNMDRIFSGEVPNSRLPVRLKPRLVAAVLVLFFLAVITAAVIVLRLGGFIGYVHEDNTQMFIINAEGSPDRIEKLYYLSDIPEGYSLSLESGGIGKYHHTVYYTSDNDPRITLHQFTKSEFHVNFDNEHRTITEWDFEGADALWVEQIDGNYNSLVWMNDEYVLEITGNLSKEDIINLAKSAEF